MTSTAQNIKVFCDYDKELVNLWREHIAKTDSKVLSTDESGGVLEWFRIE